MKVIKTSNVKKTSERWHNRPSTKATEQQHESFIERGEKEIAVVIKYDFSPGEKQTRDNPGWPAEVEIYEVTYEGYPIEISPQEDETFREEIMDRLEDDHTHLPDDRF